MARWKVHLELLLSVIDMPLGMVVGLGPGDFVLDGDPSLPPQKGSRAPNFRLMSIMPKRRDVSRCHLVTEVGLDPSDIVLDGDPAPPVPKGGAEPPVFGPYLLWPNGCMDQDET